MSAPAVSVLIPLYNSAKTVEATLASIFRQSFNDFEIVAVDDGSADDTISILRKAAKADSRLRLIEAGHGGIIKALNTGLSQCRGEFIARMDGDDICHPERLRLQAEFMSENPDVSVCSSLVRLFPRNDTGEGFLKYEEWLNSTVTHEEIAREIFIESPIVHPSVMLRTTELRELGGYREYGWPEDYDLWLRYFTAGKRFAKVPETLTFWRTHPGKLTFTDSRYSLENFIRAKAHCLAKWLIPRHKSVVVWGAGMTGRRLSKHLVREGLDIEFAVDIDLKKAGKSMRGIPIYTPEKLKDYPGLFVISAVSSQQARCLIREYLQELGRKETQDFICAA